MCTVRTGYLQTVCSVQTVTCQFALKAAFVTARPIAPALPRIASDFHLNKNHNILRTVQTNLNALTKQVLNTSE